MNLPQELTELPDELRLNILSKLDDSSLDNYSRAHRQGRQDVISLREIRYEKDKVILKELNSIALEQGWTFVDITHNPNRCNFTVLTWLKLKENADEAKEGSFREHMKSNIQPKYYQEGVELMRRNIDSISIYTNNHKAAQNSLITNYKKYQNSTKSLENCSTQGLTEEQRAKLAIKTKIYKHRMNLIISEINENGRTYESDFETLRKKIYIHPYSQSKANIIYDHVKKTEDYITEIIQKCLSEKGLYRIDLTSGVNDISGHAFGLAIFDRNVDFFDPNYGLWHIAKSRFTIPGLFTPFPEKVILFLKLIFLYTYNMYDTFTLVRMQ